MMQHSTTKSLTFTLAISPGTNLYANQVPYYVKCLYLRRASVKKMQMMAISHTNIFHNDDDTLVPNRSALVVSIIGVTGLNSANICKHHGIVSIGTYRELAKTKGITHTNPATCTVSTSFSDIPIKTIHLPPSDETRYNLVKKGDKWPRRGMHQNRSTASISILQFINNFYHSLKCSIRARLLVYSSCNI